MLVCLLPLPTPAPPLTPPASPHLWPPATGALGGLVGGALGLLALGLLARVPAEGIVIGEGWGCHHWGGLCELRWRRRESGIVCIRVLASESGSMPIACQVGCLSWSCLC